MPENFIKTIRYILVALTIIAAIILTMTGGFTEGWTGVALILMGQVIFIILLYLYNRKYK